MSVGSVLLTRSLERLSCEGVDSQSSTLVFFDKVKLCFVLSNRDSVLDEIITSILNNHYRHHGDSDSEYLAIFVLVV